MSSTSWCRSLQRRGRYRTAYEGRTLMENLGGLSHPGSGARPLATPAAGRSRRRNAAPRRRLIGRGDPEDDVFLAGLGAEHERERQSRLRDRRGRVGRHRDVALAVCAQREHRIVDGRHVARRARALRSAPRSARRASRGAGCCGRPGWYGAADLARRERRVQADQRVEAVLQDHHHVDAAQQLAQHDALVDALAPAERIARVARPPPSS